MVVRVLVVGPDAEAHARRLRDAGDEVVYLDGGTSEQVAHAAVQEDVDTVVSARAEEVRAALAAIGADEIDVESPSDG